jgi:hypothetical protein
LFVVSALRLDHSFLDGLSGYDSQNNQAYFVSDGAFGGTVFYAQVSNFTALPASAYYLLPVALLGFDPVSGSRLIAGKNINKNFFIMEKPNWGAISYFEVRYIQTFFCLFLHFVFTPRCLRQSL